MQALQIHSRNIYENCEKAHMQCYVQARSHKLTMPPRPAVVIFPGGGYDYTSDREAEPVANAYLAAGYSAFVVRYAVGADARHPHPLLDAAAAVALLRARAEEFYIDPHKIAVCGFSAGGHLAAHLGTQWHLPLLRETLGDVLDSLTPREEKVLRLRFGLEDGRSRTLEEVGKEFNVTRERIRQIEAKALRKLRHPSRSKKLKDFLD